LLTEEPPAHDVARNILTKVMPDYYVGAADCQWFCLRVLHKIMGTNEKVDKIIKSAEMEGVKMFKEEPVPLTHAQTATQDMAREVITTCTNITRTAKVYASGDIPQMALGRIPRTENLNSTEQAHIEDASNNPYHPRSSDYYGWKNGAKTATTTVMSELQEYEGRYHVAEKLKAKATEFQEKYNFRSPAPRNLWNRLTS